MRTAFAARILAIAALLGLVAMEVSARPGGGASYSGRSSTSGSSGGSSSGGSASSNTQSTRFGASPDPGEGTNPIYGSVGGNLVGYIAILLLLLFGMVWLLPAKVLLAGSLDVGGRAHASPAAPRSSPSVPSALHGRDEILALVRERDPDFSLVLFEDFACTLYVESQRARHDPRALAGLAPYWTASELASLAARPPKDGLVEAVVVGSIKPTQVVESDGRLSIECSVESNLHIRTAAGQGTLTQYVFESWTFARDLNAKTRPWQGVRKLGCPSCGAPLSAGGDARCPACGEASGAGRFDWEVTAVALHNIETRPHALTGNVVEVGTDGPTLFANNLRPGIEALFREDPALSAKSLEARLRLIFETLQSSWAAQNLEPVRPFVSDRQHDSLRYWIEAYKERGLRNLMDGPHLTRFVFVRVERDAHYDAITLRLWATGCDYTIDQQGTVVGGSRTVERNYSEYWTLIRSARARGTPRLDKNCPGCGAALTLNMAGLCDHCGAHVTSGEFDWVLSRIEQDEAYRG